MDLHAGQAIQRREALYPDSESTLQHLELLMHRIVAGLEKPRLGAQQGLTAALPEAEANSWQACRDRETVRRLRTCRVRPSPFPEPSSGVGAFCFPYLGRARRRLHRYRCKKNLWRGGAAENSRCNFAQASAVRCFLSSG